MSTGQQWWADHEEEYEFYRELCKKLEATILDIHSPDWVKHWNVLKMNELKILNEKLQRPIIEEESKKDIVRDPERIKLEAYFDIVLDQLVYLIPKVNRLNDPGLDLLRQGISIIQSIRNKIGSGG